MIRFKLCKIYITEILSNTKTICGLGKSHISVCSTRNVNLTFVGRGVLDLDVSSVSKRRKIESLQIISKRF